MIRTLLDGIPDDPIAPPDSDTSKAGNLSLTDGSRSYVDILTRMPKALDLKMTTEVSKTTDFIHKLVQLNLPAYTLLPVLPVHLEGLKEAWEKPASVPPISKRLDTLYKVQPQDANFLVSHPPATSVIVHSASKFKQP